MKRYGMMLIYLVVCCVLMSSCSALPQEETFAQAPLIRNYERTEFKLTQVKRGDIALEQKVNCSYVPVQTQTLAYPFSGVYFDKTFVKVGDVVQPGQLLAQLDLSDVEEKLNECELQIEKLGIRVAALEENRMLALERQKILLSTGTAAQLREAQQKINDEYDAQKRSLTDEISIAQLQKEEYEKQRAERQLYADIVGTVTYVRETQAGGRSVKGEKFITVADTASLFRAETKYWDLFEIGQELTISVSQKEYEAIVVSEEEIGLSTEEKKVGEKACVYFKLKQPAFDLKEGSRGTVAVVLDSREDVLMLPESVVSGADGQAIVYCPDEDGMKTYKVVETGLKAGGMIEIISGLSEGESVIMN